jgi:hypothetical protein
MHYLVHIELAKGVLMISGPWSTQDGHVQCCGTGQGPIYEVRQQTPRSLDIGCQQALGAWDHVMLLKQQGAAMGRGRSERAIGESPKEAKVVVGI